MAITNKNEAKIKFTAETTEFNNQIRESTNKMSELRAELRLNATQMQNTGTSVGGLQQKQALLRKELDENRKKQEALSQKIEAAKRIYGENSDQVSRLQRELTNTKNEEEKIKGAIHDTANAIDNQTDELKENQQGLEGVEKAGSEVREGFTVMKGVLADLAARGIELAIQKTKQLASEFVNLGKEFTATMGEVQALSGATGDELQMLEDTAREYGATTVFSATESAEALKYMALAGWSAEESTSALGGVLDLAAASGMGLGEASDMVTDYLSAFGLEAKDSAYFADMLAYAQANSNTSAKQLGEAYQNVAANMAAAGQDVETTTAMLASLANQGLKGSRAGTALAAVMRDVTNKMEEGKIRIGETSVAVQDADGNFRDLTDILKDVEKATKGMGSAEKAAALSAVFTADSIKGLNLLLNAGVKDTEDFEKQLRNSAGAAKDMSNVMQDNLSGDLKAMSSAWEELGLSIYDGAEVHLRKAAQTITREVIPALQKMDIGEKLGSAMAYTAENIDKVTIAVAGLGGGLKLLVGASNPIGLTIGAVTTLIGAVEALSIALDQGTTDFEEQKAALDNEIQALNDVRTAHEEVVAGAQEKADADLAEIDRSRELASELWKLADNSGKVDAANRQRAQYILGELNNALGTEYSMTGLNIDNYKEMQTQIYAVIEAKKAQALLDAMLPAYTEAVQLYANAQDDVAQKYYDLTIAQQEEQAAMQELEDARSSYIASDVIAAQENYTQKKAILDQSTAAYKESDAQLQLYYSQITGYENAQVAAMKGNNDTVTSLLTGKSSAFSQTADDIKTDSDRTVDTLYQEAIQAGIKADLFKRNWENGVDGYTEQMVKDADRDYKAAINKFANGYSDAKKQGANISNGLRDGMESGRGGLLAKAESLVSGVIARMRAAADSHSPSKKTIALGEDMGEGAEIGILNKLKSAKNAARDFTDGILSAMAPQRNYSAAVDSRLGAVSASYQRNVILQMNGKTVASTIVSDLDSLNGARINLANRGLAL